MSKLSFRARALDCSKPMPVYRSEEIPDLPDFAAINRAVPQMPTGMEKEEETEHHLQRALSAQQVYGTAEALVIPVPEVNTLGLDYDKLYPSDYRVSKQYIHIQALGMDQEIPDYDLDSDDEVWLSEQSKKMEITPLQFEEMIDRLEKGSGQQVVSLQEAKLLLKQDDDLTMSVYDYWLNKKLRMQHALIPQVKSEKRDGTTTNNPYVAFRRRTEKMQTRKNRKNDEASYEKMLKLRRDLNKAVTILEMIKKREKCKKELLQLTIEILEKRYQMEDYCGQHLTYAESQKATRPAFFPVFDQLRVAIPKVSVDTEVAATNRKPKREYKKRKHKQAAPVVPGEPVAPASYMPNSYDIDVTADTYTSDEERQSPDISGSDRDDENDPDGPYSFRRKKFCTYLAPLDVVGDWPWSGENRRESSDRKYRYCRTSLCRPHPRFVGFARRRIGRGGRMLLDRAFMETIEPWNTELERYLDRLPSSPIRSEPSELQNSQAAAGNEKVDRPPHFWPAGLDQFTCDSHSSAFTVSTEACTAFGLTCSQDVVDCRDSLSDRDCSVIPSATSSSLLIQLPLDLQHTPAASAMQQQQPVHLSRMQPSATEGAGLSPSVVTYCARRQPQQQLELSLVVRSPDGERPTPGAVTSLLPLTDDIGSPQQLLKQQQHHRINLQQVPVPVASGLRVAHSFSSQSSSRFVIDSSPSPLAGTTLSAVSAAGQQLRISSGQSNGPLVKSSPRSSVASAAATSYAVASTASDVNTTAVSALSCGSSSGSSASGGGGVPLSILSTKPGGTSSFPAVLRVGVTPNESGDSLTMSSLVQPDLDYGDALLRGGINNIDNVTSMEVS